MQWASGRVQRTGSGRVSQDVSASGNGYVGFQRWRRPSLVQDLVPCRLLVVTCARMRWTLLELESESGMSTVERVWTLQETRRASIQPSRPRQLRRRYNFISLLCAPCLPPIYLLIRPHTFIFVIFVFLVIILATRQYICPSRTGLCSATESHCTRRPEAMLLLGNCVTEHY
jgi:hypothetical protein